MINNFKLQKIVDWPSEGNIDFVNYSVKYREELDFVLKDINLSIKSSEKVNINYNIL